jgi:gas vesicle protein
MNREMNWVPACAFLAGAVAGGVAAILFAPYAGQETRSRLKSGFESGKSAAKRKSQELASTIAEQSEHLMETGKKKIADEVKRIDSALEAGKSAYRQTMMGQA